MKGGFIMMKWKARTETTNIGVLELGNLTFDEDYMEVSLDICGMSDGLKTELDKAIEIEKVKYTEEKKKDLAEGSVHPLKRSITWSDKPVVMNYTYLRVRLQAGRPIDYSIMFGFTDAVDLFMEAWGGSITVDLSEHAEELKKAIIKVIIDRFF